MKQVWELSQIQPYCIQVMNSVFICLQTQQAGVMSTCTLRMFRPKSVPEKNFRQYSMEEI